MLSSRSALLFSIPTLALLLFFVSRNYDIDTASYTLQWPQGNKKEPNWTPAAKADKKFCDKHHSKLYEDVERTEKYWSNVGGMTRADLEESRHICERDGNCPILKLYDGHLYMRFPVLHELSFQSRAHSMLLMLARTDLSHLPNSDFLFNANDGVRLYEPCFLEMDKSLAEVASTSRKQLNHFLFPDFTTFDWWEASLPPFQITRTSLPEKSQQFSKKVAKLFWRGSTVLQQGTQRTDLVAQLGPRTDIADVKDITDLAPAVKKQVFKTLSEMCDYRYIVYTEGITYSGRLKYTTLCNSVQIGYKITFIEFWTHLIEPYYVNVNSWDEAVDRMAEFEKDLAKAELLARGQVDALREQLTPKGISCYIQRMMEGYAKSQRWNVLSPQEDVTGKNASGDVVGGFHWVPLDHFLARALWAGSESLRGANVTWPTTT